MQKPSTRAIAPILQNLSRKTNEMDRIRIPLLPLFERCFELLREQGLFKDVETERDAEDFVARIGNSPDPIRIIVGPHCLYATCRHGYTDPISIMPDEGPEEARALGAIASAILRQSIRRKLATPDGVCRSGPFLLNPALY